MYRSDDLKNFKAPLTKWTPRPLTVIVALVLSAMFVNKNDQLTERELARQQYRLEIRPPCNEWMASKADQEKWKLRFCRRMARK